MKTKMNWIGASFRMAAVGAGILLGAIAGREISIASEIPPQLELPESEVGSAPTDAMDAAAAVDPAPRPSGRQPDEKDEALEPAERARFKVSEVKSKKLRGLDHEGLDKKALEKLMEQARDYVSFRKGKLSAERRASVVASCLARSTDNPFCDYLVEEKKSDRPSARSKVSRTNTRDRLFKLSERLAKGELDAARDVREYEVFRALALFPNWEVLQPIADKALAGGGCHAPVQLLMALGTKAEEFFPEERFKKLAASLYGRAHQCGEPEEPAADKARYRLALLHIWSGECAAAEPVLERLSNNPVGEYVTRAYYWTARCAERRGDTLKASLMRNKLQQVNPLGFHTLALFRKDPFQIIQAVNPDEPKVRFREPGRMKVNRLARGIELLQAVNARGYGQELVEELKRNIVGASPEFLLYVALLTERNNDNVGTFGTLAKLIREHPSFISSSTLEIVFPLERFKIIRKHENKIDPYLVVSLIRQESAFNVRARSRAGAMGLMQLMPATARQMARVSKWSLYNPAVNIRVGVKYLDRLIRRFDGDTELALAAYNAGPGNVTGWLSRYPTEDRMLFIDLIPFKETRNYVALIGRNYFWYMGLYSNRGLYLSELATRKIASEEPGVLFKSLSPFH